VNDYQIQIFPVPHFAPLKSDTVEVPGFSAALDAQAWDQAFRLIEPLLATPPFPASVMVCLVPLVERISRIEAERGDIARTERLALAPEARPLQDLIDRMLYRMAGLTDEEAAGLEDRLSRML
jgi:hypothetical protein